MTRADELKERARRLVELVMTTDAPLSAEFLQDARADVHRLEMEACAIDAEQYKRAATNLVIW